MKKSDRIGALVFPILIVLGFSLAFGISQGGSLILGMPLLLCLVGIVYLMQWLVFIPAFIFQSEKFFDLTGSLTYMVIASLALFMNENAGFRAILLWLLVMVWAVRLGSFLFVRIQKAGKDDRFDALKPSFIRFLNVWTIQGLWVSLTMAAALVAITANQNQNIDWYAVVGTLVWIAGFIIEVVADAQKSRFNKDPNNKGQFIRSGLWARSRHPNYFGEIMVWLGIALISLPVFTGIQWLALISPVFVILLLTRVSGIPLLEKKADKKWGGQWDYEDYKNRTPVLVPTVKTPQRRHESYK